MQAGRGRLELIGEPAYVSRDMEGCRERESVAASVNDLKNPLRARKRRKTKRNLP